MQNIIEQSATAAKEGRNRAIYDANVGRWARNAAANYQLIYRHGLNIEPLEMTYANPKRGCIVCGRGSSLDEALTEAKDKFKRYHVITCLSSLPALIANGIRPLYVVAYDAGVEAVKHIADIDTGQLSLIAMTSIHPLLVQNWRGPIFFFNQYHKGMEFFEVTLRAIYPGFPAYYNAGCVANISVVIAADIMKFDPVYLIGVEYPLDNSRPYIAVDYIKSKDNGWERIERGSEEMSEEQIVTHRTYREILLTWMHKFKFPIVNCSPYASFKEEVPFKAFAEI